MITVSTEFYVKNLKLFSSVFVPRITCGGCSEDTPWLHIHEYADNHNSPGIISVLFSINYTGSPILFENKYDPDAMCEALSHYITRGTRMSLYLIDEDGSIETHYISSGIHCQV